MESVEIVDKPAVSENSHNPEGLTPEQYGATEGYRLLYEDEIKDRQTPYIKIEIWLKDFGWLRGCFGSSKLQTFRTKLSREELAKLD